MPLELSAGEAQAEITALYQQVLGRAPTGAELASGTQQLLAGTPLSSIQAGLATSWYAVGDLTTVYQAIYGEVPSAGVLAAAETQLADGQTLQQVEAPWAADGQAEIVALYQQVLGRNPDPTGLAAWMQQLLHGIPLSAIRIAFATSQEVINDLTAVFQAVYSEAPSANVLTAAETQLADGQTLQQVEAPWAGAGQAEITILYQQVLGRNPDPTGFAAWTQQLLHGTPLSAIRTAFATSQEVANDLTAAFQAIYDEAPSAGALTAAEAQLADGQTLQQVEAPWAADGQAEIVLLYEQVAGRNPDPTGLAAWTQQLLHGTPLSAIRTAFATSQEVVNDLTAVFQAVYSEAPSANVLTVAETQLADGQTLQQVEAPWAADGQTALTTIYQQVLGRAPTAPELLSGTQQLLAGVPLSSIRAGLATSQEAASNLTTVYQAIYSEAPSASVLTAAETQLAGGQTLQQVEAPWVADGQTALTTIYQQMLGRAPTAAELASGTQQLLAGVPLSSIRAGLATSQEAASNLTTVYQTIYGEAPSASVLTAAETQLADGQTLQQVEAPWAADGQAEIVALYQQVLGRNPDPTGLAAWTQQLVHGTPLSAIRTAFATSQEVVNDLTAAFEAIYDEAPSTTLLNIAETELGNGVTLENIIESLSDVKGVSGLYDEVFGSTDQVDITVWSQDLINGDPVDQVLTALGNTSAATSLLLSLAAGVMGGTPSPTQLTVARNLLIAGGSLQEVQAAFAMGLPTNPQTWLAPEPQPINSELLNQQATQDFMSLFSAGSPWSDAGEPGTVFVISTQAVLWSSESDLQQLFAYLNANHIKLAISALMLPMGADGVGSGVEGFNGVPGTMGAVAARIASLGGDLSYVLMDQPLYGGHEYTGNNAAGYTIDEVAQQVATNATAILNVFPDVQFGDTEPVPATPTSDIMQFATDFQETVGRPLSFFQADVQWQVSWQTPLEQLAQQLRQAGVQFDMIYQGDSATTTSSAEWVQTAWERIVQVESDPLLQPGSGIIATWSDFPANALPENDPDTLTYLELEYENIAPLFRDGILSPLSTDAPQIAAPTSVTVQLGQANPISGLSLSLDSTVPDGGNVAVMLSDSTGLLQVNGSQGITGNDTTTLTLSGTLTEVNSELSSLSYIGRAGGTDDIQVSSYDGGGTPGQQQLSVTVADSQTSEAAIATITPSSLLLPSSMSYVSASGSNPLLLGTSGSDLFDLTGSWSGTAEIRWFDPTDDMIDLPKAVFPDFAAVQASMITAPGGTDINFGSGYSAVVSGTSPQALHSFNFVLS